MLIGASSLTVIDVDESLNFYINLDIISVMTLVDADMLLLASTFVVANGKVSQLISFGFNLFAGKNSSQIISDDISA